MFRFSDQNGLEFSNHEYPYSTRRLVCACHNVVIELTVGLLKNKMQILGVRSRPLHDHRAP